METFSALLAMCNSPVSGEFPPQRPVTRSFDIFFDLRLNKRLSKQCVYENWPLLNCINVSHDINIFGNPMEIDRSCLYTSDASHAHLSVKRLFAIFVANHEKKTKALGKYKFI